MVHIRPFPGLRYNPQQVTDMEAVVAPPYDVISAAEQQALHEKSPYNVVRLILGLKQPSDSESQNVYTRAHETLEAWREAGVLTAESQPAFYAYSQQWDGLERRGIIAAMQLEDYESGQVLPHEYTLGGPKADRLALMKATGTVLSPIFCLYHDPEKRLEAMLFEVPPAVKPLEVYDHDRVFHRFWPVIDAQQVDAIQTLLADKAALIADGHHRYETAVAYSQWRREQDGQQGAPKGSLPCDYTMAFFTNMADEGLKVYPTHRVFDSLPQGWTAESLLQAMAESFEPVSEEKALFWVQHGTGPKQAFGLKASADLSGIPEALRPLDVAILDALVFQGILKQAANELKQQGHLHFVRDEQEVLDSLKQGALVFWVHAPDVDEVRRICESGLRMPQKSTYFYPKLLSGLVMYYYGTHPLAPGQASWLQSKTGAGRA